MGLYCHTVSIVVNTISNSTFYKLYNKYLCYYKQEFTNNKIKQWIIPINNINYYFECGKITNLFNDQIDRYFTTMPTSLINNIKLEFERNSILFDTYISQEIGYFINNIDYSIRSALG